QVRELLRDCTVLEDDEPGNGVDIVVMQLFQERWQVDDGGYRASIPEELYLRVVEDKFFLDVYDDRVDFRGIDDIDQPIEIFLRIGDVWIVVDALDRLEFERDIQDAILWHLQLLLKI